MPPARMTIILAQFLIAMIMAFLMTGIFTALPAQFAPGWVAIWMQRFLIAWPVAFVLSLGVGPLAFFLADRITRFIDWMRVAA